MFVCMLGAFGLRKRGNVHLCLCMHVPYLVVVSVVGRRVLGREVGFEGKGLRGKGG